MDLTQNRFCQIVNHQNMEIQMVCMSLSSECATRFLCRECHKLHSQHFNDCYTLQDFFKILAQQRVKYCVGFDSEVLKSRNEDINTARQILLKQVKIVFGEYIALLVKMINKHNQLILLFDKASNIFNLSEEELKEVISFIDDVKLKTYKLQTEQECWKLKVGIQQVMNECNNFKLTTPQWIDYNIIAEHWTIPLIHQGQHQYYQVWANQTIKLQAPTIPRQCCLNEHNNKPIEKVCMIQSCSSILMCINCYRQHGSHIQECLQIYQLHQKIKEYKQKYIIPELSILFKIMKEIILRCQNLIEEQVKFIIWYQIQATVLIKEQYNLIQKHYDKANSQQIVNISHNDISLQGINNQQRCKSTQIGANKNDNHLRMLQFQINNPRLSQAYKASSTLKKSQSDVAATQLNPPKITVIQPIFRTQMIKPINITNLQRQSVGFSKLNYFVDKDNRVVIFEEGQQHEGKKVGYWKIYSSLKAHIGGGMYIDGVKNGVWQEVDVSQQNDDIMVDVYDCTYINGLAGNRVLNNSFKH